MKPSIKRMLSAVISLVFIIAATVVFLKLIQPEYAVLERNKSTKAAQEEQIDRKKNIDELIAKQSDNYNKNSGYRDVFTAALPARPAIDMALAQIDYLAGQNNISLSSVAVSETTPPLSDSARRDPYSLEALVGKYKTISLNVVAAGQYDNFRKFVENIESGVRIIDIKDMSVQQSALPNSPTSSRNQAQAPVYIYNLNLNAYYLTN